MADSASSCESAILFRRSQPRRAAPRIGRRNVRGNKFAQLPCQGHRHVLRVRRLASVTETFFQRRENREVRARYRHQQPRLTSRCEYRDPLRSSASRPANPVRPRSAHSMCARNPRGCGRYRDPAWQCGLAEKIHAATLPISRIPFP